MTFSSSLGAPSEFVGRSVNLDGYQSAWSALSMYVLSLLEPGLFSVSLWGVRRA